MTAHAFAIASGYEYASGLFAVAALKRHSKLQALMPTRAATYCVCTPSRVLKIIFCRNGIVSMKKVEHAVGIGVMRPNVLGVVTAVSAWGLGREHRIPALVDPEAMLLRL